MYGWEFKGVTLDYLGRCLPAHQAQLLKLWDNISCPYDNTKQPHSHPLKIIGFYVDMNLGTITLSPDSILDINSKIETFLAHSASDQAPILHDWQRLTGHLNWLLNVLPWGRPALQVLYDKMKHYSMAKIYLNKSVVQNLTWLKVTIPSHTGVWFIDNGLWADKDADRTIWTDASSKFRLSFVYNEGKIAVAHAYEPGERSSPQYKVNIFFLELMAILSAIHHFALLPMPLRRVLVYTDSLDSVVVFHSLHAREQLHNRPLLVIASIII